MSLRISMNKSVNITSVMFKKGLQTFPRRMEYEGKTVCFKDGFSYAMQTEESEGNIYDMDTETGEQFRLFFDNILRDWTLLRITRTV